MQTCTPGERYLLADAKVVEVFKAHVDFSPLLVDRRKRFEVREAAD